jgi:uncharacterized repeat protein (TIGR02543 family)
MIVSPNATGEGDCFIVEDTLLTPEREGYINIPVSAENLEDKYSQSLYLWEVDISTESYPVSIESRITFDANGGSVGTNTKNVTFTYAYGDLPTPTREHYRFLGWYTQKTGGTQVTKDTEVTTYSKHTLYAHWEQCEYTVTFNTNGGTDVKQATIAYGSPVVFSNYTTTREGYIFEGWYTKNGTNGDWGDEAISYTDLTGNITLYAKWKEPISITGTVYVAGSYQLDGQTHIITHFGHLLRKLRERHVAAVDLHHHNHREHILQNRLCNVENVYVIFCTLGRDLGQNTDRVLTDNR